MTRTIPCRTCHNLEDSGAGRGQSYSQANQDSALDWEFEAEQERLDQEWSKSKNRKTRVNKQKSRTSESDDTEIGSWFVAVCVLLGLIIGIGLVVHFSPEIDTLKKEESVYNMYVLESMSRTPSYEATMKLPERSRSDVEKQLDAAERWSFIGLLIILVSLIPPGKLLMNFLTDVFGQTKL